MTQQLNKENLQELLIEKASLSKVLLVGAGGIGCELLKNLLLSGFKEIHIVDLDLIDLSNLNRQFLFQKKHIKKPKALVAKESAQKFNPRAKLEAYHSDIKDPKFNVFWFKKFTLVFNALDNLDTRRHVNKMCLTADVPLIESGTAGFRGQVQGKTECYDCNPKEIPETYPICTIRTKPTLPIHCIIWAKKEDIFKNIKNSIDNKDFIKKLFEKLYFSDIMQLKSVENICKILKVINPLSYEDLQLKAITINEERLKNSQLVWSIEENFHLFLSSFKILSKRFLSLLKSSTDNKPIILFDKDDDDILNFVSASANLRSYVFGIEPQSKFKIKQMAGNIIPSISTTNSIISGICVLQAFHILSNNLNFLRTVYYSRRPERIFNSEPISSPNPKCEVCGVERFIFSVNLHLTTLKNLVVDVLQKGLGYGNEISIISDRLLYDIEFEDNLDKLLKDIGIQNGTFLTIIDEEDSIKEPNRKNIILVIEEKYYFPYCFYSNISRTFKNKKKPYSMLNITIPRCSNDYRAQEKNKINEDDSFSILKKRKSNLSDSQSTLTSKKTKTDHIIIEDDDSDVAVLDSI
ncbi:hypothetical protein PCANB_001577 [Pneumocystis canis]|nr:hypothetical protein PCANB_001577 [Pneumocystis canis]